MQVAQEAFQLVCVHRPIPVVVVALEDAPNLLHSENIPLQANIFQ